MVAVLAARAPRSLRRLEISGTDGSKATSIASIWPRLERLEEIEISNVTALGEIVLPNLVRATIDISDPALLASLATAGMAIAAARRYIAAAASGSGPPTPRIKR